MDQEDFENLIHICIPMIQSRKILIVGTSCTGKTTLAAELAKKMGIVNIDLDDLHWLPDWKMRSKAEMKALIRSEIMPRPQWIVSGNYTTAGRDSIWKEAETIIWLDYPLHFILGRYVKRTYRRIVTKEPCCNGNIETLSNAVFTKEILLRYILSSHFGRRPLYKSWMNGEMSDKQWIVLKGQEEADELLASGC